MKEWTTPEVIATACIIIAYAVFVLLIFRGLKNPFVNPWKDKDPYELKTLDDSALQQLNELAKRSGHPLVERNTAKELEARRQKNK